MASSAEHTGELARFAKQLEDIKRLMIMQLIASGVQSAQVAKTLGIHPSVISRIVPVREIQTASSRRRSTEPDG
jgi:IS30 family transposase